MRIIIIACLRAQLCHSHHFPSVLFISACPGAAARLWQMHADFCSCALTCRLRVNETWGASSRAAKKGGPPRERPLPAARFGPHKGRRCVAWHTDPVLLLRCSILLWRVCNPFDRLEQLIPGSVRSVISAQAFSDYIRSDTAPANYYVQSRTSSRKTCFATLCLDEINNQISCKNVF